MPSINFGVRLVFDEDFYESEIKTDPKLLTKLMYINARALGHKRHFNILPRKIFNKILENNGSMSRELLKCSFYDFEEEKLEEIEDEVERIIKYAIHIIKEEPHKKSFIMTSKRKENDYLNNRHFQNSKDVSVKAGEEAKEILNGFWEDCTTK
ncbi:MAG: hypothetical protein ABIJ05_04605 [Patescibacteria group bacterium]